MHMYTLYYVYMCMHSPVEGARRSAQPSTNDNNINNDNNNNNDMFAID